MELTSILKWDNIEQHIAKLGKKVIVDCGHCPVRIRDGELVFGGLDGISDTTLNTFLTGLSLYRLLKQRAYQVKLSICFSDTSRLLKAKDARQKIKDCIREKNWETCLPHAYLHALTEEERDDIVLSLQTQNSNLFTNLIKKIKTKSKKSASQQDFYGRFNALALKSQDDDLFSITTPYLLDTQKEDRYFGSADWINDEGQDNERSLTAMPLLRLKKMGMIHLYEKSSGILCPATYGGLLLNFDNSWDHIAVYARADDAFIAEKLLRGVIATNVCHPEFNRKCLQIVFSESSNLPEVSLITSESVKNPTLTYPQFIDKLTKKGLFDTMTYYKESELNQGASA